MSQPQNRNRVRPDLFFSLVLLFLAFYMATYSGRIESGDSLRVLDAATSFVHFGDTRLDETVWQNTFTLQLYNAQPYPFSTYEANEPVIAYVASFALAIANFLPEIGLVHATWLVNIFFSAFTIACFYLYARFLAYENKFAILASLLLGFCTLLWPYSKTLFREPLAMFLLFLTALSIEKWRENYRHLWWLAFAACFVLIAYYTKNSTIFALPALFILALPEFKGHFVQRLSIVALLLGISLILAFAFFPISFELLRQALSPIIRLHITYAQAALHSYLFSIGGSLWGTSPILLLGVFGAFINLRRGNTRIVLSIFTLITAYALAHAIFTDQHWFGGLSWPPRFLVPVVPFAMLLLLPVLECLGESRRLIWRFLALLLIAYSFIIQIIASISWQDDYVKLLPAESGGLVEWGQGLNNPQYLRWFLLPQSWESLGFDIAWTRSGAPIFIILFLLIAAAIIGLFLWRKWVKWLLCFITITFLLIITLAMRHLYQADSVYWADKPALFEVLEILERESDENEPLLLASNADVTYERFILNYLRSNTVRPVALGFQWGELTSPSDSPRVISNNVTDLFLWDIPRLIDYLANQHERLWWLAHNSIYTTWAVRVEERYLTENYYLLHEYPTADPLVRLLEFSTVRAPNPHDFRLPEILSDLRYGDSISLRGFTLPLGTTYQAGDIVPISFYWQTDTLLEADYSVSWFIAHEAVQYLPIQGIDSQPQNSFAPTQTWQPNQLIIDNRAIELPLDVPTGTYQIWLRVYRTGSGGADALPVSGTAIYDETLGILPISLIITN